MTMVCSCGRVVIPVVPVVEVAVCDNGLLFRPSGHCKLYRWSPPVYRCRSAVSLCGASGFGGGDIVVVVACWLREGEVKFECRTNVCVCVHMCVCV